MITGFLQSLKAALESLDTDRVVSHYSDDVVFTDPAAGDSWAVTGKEELRTYFQRLFSLPEAKFEVASIFECNGWGAAEWIWSGSRPDDNGRYRTRGASIVELRGGKIIRETIYYDPRPGPS